MPAGLTADVIAARLRRRFGDRAWSAEAVRRFRLNNVQHGRLGRVEANPALRTFVDARVGAMTLDQLARLVRERFGAGAPKRSSLQRYMERERRRLNARAGAEAAT